ncbi:hypothetical protein MPSEU_000971800 [Mayamaea pseudoterrestris]|nr:hypothetical protein MPSEU_000971800 [Mayamaea pseudoterrestris]
MLPWRRYRTLLSFVTLLHSLTGSSAWMRSVVRTCRVNQHLLRTTTIHSHHLSATFDSTSARGSTIYSSPQALPRVCSLDSFPTKNYRLTSIPLTTHSLTTHPTTRLLVSPRSMSSNASTSTNNFNANGENKQSTGSRNASNAEISDINNTTDTTAPAPDYDVWVRRLYTTNLYQPVKMGLDNIQQLYNLLGKPLDDVPVIHIAGTNGKGSVAWKLAKTLEAAGRSNSNVSKEYKVGLFVSPHVSSFRERMQVNGCLISERDVVKHLPRIYDLCHEHNIPATFFELTTALAMLHFHAQQVDAVVLETGLGGRLDATNILTNPALTIVTSIGLEHTRILGDTLAKIATEKAGIFKAGRPVLVGPVASSIAEVDETLRACAARVNAGPYYTCDELLVDENDNGTTSSSTDYDVINSRIVTAAIRVIQKDETTQRLFPPISDEAIRTGTSQRPPCRFEHVLVPNPDNQDDPLTVILDVAHNPEAMEYLVNKLKATYDLSQTAIRMVVGMSSDKDLGRCGQAVLELVGHDASRVHLVQASTPRAATLQQLLDIPGFRDGAHYNLEDPSVAPQITKAVELSLQAKAAAASCSNQRQNLLVVCGSVFIMADARQALGIDEPRDSEYVAHVGGSGARNGQENFGGK